MKRSILALLALAVTASCGDNGTDPDDFAASGALTFSYNGGALLAAGTYSASGGMPLNPNDQENRTWSAGFRDPKNSNNLGIVGTVARSDRFDFAVLVFDRSTAGTSTIDVAACDTETCPAMIFWYNLSESSTATGEVLCGLETGTLTIASVTATRATGTFSGTGSCFTFESSTESVLTITNGSFDVPIVSDIPTAGSGLMIRNRARAR